MSDLRSRLAAPFAAKDIEWRIARSGIKDGKPWGMCLAYITNRAIMDRLDEVVGPEGWRNEYQRWGEHGVLCGLSLRIAGMIMAQEIAPGVYPVNSDWVTKWDGAEETDIESVKGGLSAAMKRAAVQWGIGRYLYDLEEGWAVFGSGPYSAKIDGSFYRWAPPALPKWALPEGEAPAKPAKSKSEPEAPAPLSEMPPALKEDLDNDLPLEDPELSALLKEVAAAGITKVGFGEFYTRVMGKLYDKVIRVGDVKAIRAEASKLLAQKGRRAS